MKNIILTLMLSFIMNDLILFDFTAKANITNWRIIDDRVMGGVSYGNFKLDNDGHGVFFGSVSTENNGGFSSVRYQFEKMNVSNFSKVSMRLKSDGKDYQFRIKDNRNAYYSYITSFKTSGKWETIVIELKDLYPSFRGQTLNMPNFKGEFLEEVVFLVGNKKNESFELQLDKIELIK